MPDSWHNVIAVSGDGSQIFKFIYFLYIIIYYEVIYYFSLVELDIPLCFRIIKGVKTVNTTLFIVFIATCFNPTGSSSG
jgi:hypothetical protein